MSRMDLQIAVTESTEFIITADDESLSLRVPFLDEPEEGSLSDVLNLEIGGDIEIILTTTEIRSIS